MAHRRISSTEKGKAIDTGTHEPPREARVKAPLPDNAELLRKHSLTLIGRVTNKSIQKVWSLIPFFTEHWKTEFKPIGSDLGNGLFQFQFELESDLLSVLDQRPYHYARWLIILQRWEPTVSPSFPSLIPFWIKVQGLPVHLWTEPIVEVIGRNIGWYEKAEITKLSVRMRVHVNGLLPLITHSMVEFPNGDEVATTLVYERLDKHCTKCLRLDHELKECLVARAEVKALKARQENSSEQHDLKTHQSSESIKGNSTIPVEANRIQRSQEHSKANFRFSAPARGLDNDRRHSKPSRGYIPNRGYKNNPLAWQEKASSRRSQQSRERSRFYEERYPRSREDAVENNLPRPPVQYSSREDSKRDYAMRDTGSSASRSGHVGLPRGNPHRIDQVLSQKNSELEARRAEKEAAGSQHHNPNLQETAMLGCKDITINEGGRLEEAVLQVVRASLTLADQKTPPTSTPQRQHVSQRIGEQDGHLSGSSERAPLRSPISDKSRTPASLRLGPSEPLRITSSDRVPISQRLGDQSGPTSGTRGLASQRLGPMLSVDNPASPQNKATAKKRVGRPPGKVKKPASPLVGKEGTTKNRKVPAPKTSNCRRKITVEGSRNGGKSAKEMKRGETSRQATSGGTTHSSDNIPISTMIPKSTRRRADFRAQPDPAP